jgi:hypothetical protein
MKRLKTLLIYLTLIPSFAFAQFNSEQNFINPSNGMANIAGTNVSMQKDIYEGVKGSPMFCKDFVKGFIVTKDSFNLVNDYRYNFDVFKQELRILAPDGNVKIPYNNQIRGFQLIENGIAHNFKKAIVPNDNGDKFYEIIAETQQYSLLKLHIKKFVRANATDNGITQTGKRYDEFENSETYFLKVSDGVYKEIKKLTKANFIEFLPNRKTDIEAYWKTNKLGKKMTELEARGFLKALEIAKN